MPDTGALAFHPLTPERWPDLERLFGPNGACAGCWCMFWRMRGPDYRRSAGAEKKLAFKRVCRDAGRPPGVIAYRDGMPVGWVAIAPRADYIRLAEARVLAPIDDKPVWSITCFFIHRTARRQGLMEKLIDAAVDFARDEGARLIEAYPKPVTGKMASTDLYVGTVRCFERAGFAVVARPSEARAIMRRAVRMRPRARPA
ncbi:MAG TPA: GNAT family N-acetyltransferase [Dongiaceae bacterium]|jgi:GNAT superfamily N-acetyltransferase|nr:GNAT family N-acetyltransferase [Dongiaceae bacterium]